MCVLAFAWRAHPRWPLIVAGNRDELHARPAAPLARWEGPGDVIAGRDLQSGGTWLGVSERGRFAVVTNLHAPSRQRADAPSRGRLVADFLAGEGLPEVPGQLELARFNPFNLILAEGGDAWFVSNQEPIRRLEPGIYGLSNATLDEPWPKVTRLKAAVRDWIDEDAVSPERLLEALSDELSGVAPGIAEPVGESLPQPRNSPIFIRNPRYGTRCSTVVAVNEEREGVIVERRFDPQGQAKGETAVSFNWPR